MLYRTLSIFAFFAFFTIGLLAVPACPAGAFERCIMCGMDAQKSETKFSINLVKGDKKIKPGKYSFCCLHCLVLFRAHLKDGKIDSITARDYNSITSGYDSGDMIPAEDAFYLVESSLRPNGSMVPFMLIFANRKTAEIYKKAYGGKILKWTEILKYTKP